MPDHPDPALMRVRYGTDRNDHVTAHYWRNDLRRWVAMSPRAARALVEHGHAIIEPPASR